MANDLNINLKLNDQASDKLVKALDKITNEQEKATKSAVNFAAKLYVVQQAMNVVISAARKVGEVIELGAKIDQQATAFDNLAFSVNASSNQIIRDLRELSGQTLTTSEVMQNASKAIILGLDPKQLGSMMEIARASARAFGTDVDYMFESIALGIGRQSKMILDNLGIIVNAEAAYSKYANSLHKTVDKLTEAEKRQAFMNATMEAGQNILKKVDIEQESTAEKIGALKASWKELNETISRSVSELDFYKSAVSGITNLLDNISKNISGPRTLEQYNEELLKINKQISDLREGAAEEPSLFQKILGSISGFQMSDMILQNLDTLAERQRQLIEERTQLEEEEHQRKIERQQELYGLETQLSEFNRMNADRVSFQQQQQLQKIEDMKKGMLQVVGTIENNMSNALSGVIRGTMSVKEGFKSIGEAAIKAVVDFVAQQIIANTIGQAMRAAVQATVTAMGQATAAAWAPAAAAVSLATLGGNAVPAAAAITSTNALAMATFVSPVKRQFGGDDIVTRPTLFMAGEAGAERVSVSPSGNSGFGGRGGIVINIYEPTVRNESDIDALAERLGNEVELNLRGARA